MGTTMKRACLHAISIQDHRQEDQSQENPGWYRVLVRAIGAILLAPKVFWHSIGT